MVDVFDDPSDPVQPTAATAEEFFSSGSPSCRFETIGTAHQGLILNFSESQQRDLKSGEPAFWPDGNKKMMLVITLQTEERDPAIEDDDGERRLYVNKPSGMFAAIKAAIGKEKFAVGGILGIKYTGNGKPKTPGFNPPKEYKAKYVPPGGMKAGPSANHAGEVAAQKIAAFKIFESKTIGMTPQARLQEFKDTVIAYHGSVPNEQLGLTASEWLNIANQIAARGPVNHQEVSPPVDDGEIPF